MMSHTHARQSLERLADSGKRSTLPPALAHHLQECDDCRAYGEQLDRLGRELHWVMAARWPLPRVPDHLESLAFDLERRARPRRAARRLALGLRAWSGIAAAGLLLLLALSWILGRPTPTPAQPTAVTPAPSPTAGFTPTPPVKQGPGTGPFLTQQQALAAAEQQRGGELQLVTAELVTEAEARRRAQDCQTFAGHPDSVWVLTVLDGSAAQRTRQLFLDAASGEILCGEELPAASITTAAPAASEATRIYPPPVATLQAIGMEDAGCPNPAGVEHGAELAPDEALEVMRAYFSGDTATSQRVRDPALWYAGLLARPDEQLQPGWFQTPRRAAESPYAELLGVHCGEETLAASWTVVYCNGDCLAPGISASLMEDYFLLRRAGQWLIWYVWP